MPLLDWGQTVVNIRSSRMLMGHGFLARIFEIFGRHKIVVNMVSTSEVTVSVTIHKPRNLEDVVEEQLKRAVKDLKEFAEVEIERDRAAICVVGEGLRKTPGIVGDIFQAIRDAGVSVLMISQGASKINVAFLVADGNANTAVEALHNRFFSSKTAAVSGKKA